jgi:hypothetical protein
MLVSKVAILTKHNTKAGKVFAAVSRTRTWRHVAKTKYTVNQNAA